MELGCCAESAAEAPADDAAGGSPPSELALGGDVARRRVIAEMIVSAQKREETLGQVPISITALSGELLTESGVENMHDLVEFTPNVTFTNNPSFPRVFIRGFGTPFSGTLFESSVGLSVDDLPLEKVDFMADPLFDIERFEVLRGPQGILFGKNTTAGLFNVTTRRPTDELTGDLFARIGTLETYRVESAVGGPLGPLGKVAQFRLAVLESRQPSDVFNTKSGLDAPGTEQRAGRLQLALQPVSGLDILLIGERAITDLDGPAFGDTQNKDLRDSSVQFLRQFDPRFEDDGFNHQASMDLEKRAHRTSDRLQANVGYTPGDLGPVRNTEIVAIVGMAEYDNPGPLDLDFSPAAIIEAVNDIVYEQRTAEIRFSGLVPGPFGFGDIDLLTGFLFSDSHQFSDDPIVAHEHFDEWLLSPPAFELVTGEPAPGGMGFSDLTAAAAALGVPPPSSDGVDGDGLRPTADQDSRSYAVFGRGAWHLTDQWTVSVGATFRSSGRMRSSRTSASNRGFFAAHLGRRITASRSIGGRRTCRRR